MQSVSVQQHGPVAVVVIDNPPVNALSWHVRQGIADALEATLGDDAVKAIVLRCEGRTFIAGADLTEAGKAPSGPGFGDAVRMMEGSTKPLIAAIHGAALGGGLETALCCHYRVAVPSAKFGLPEVTLGLLPGGGGTQRLPRLIGLERAAEMCLLGKPVAAEAALSIGLIDGLAREDALAEDAIMFARRVVDLPVRPVRDRPVTGDVAMIDRLERDHATEWRGFDAPFAILRCIRAAAELPDIDDGLAVERREFTTLLAGEQSAAQRHLFFAERQAAKVDGIGRDIAARPTGRVAVFGPDDPSLLSWARRVPVQECDVALVLGDPGDALPDFAARAPADAVLLLPVADVDAAAADARAESVVGIDIAGLRDGAAVEVVRGARTGPVAIATAIAVAKRSGRLPYVTRSGPRFAFEDTLAARDGAVARLRADGIAQADIDAAWTAFGFRGGASERLDPLIIDASFAPVVAAANALIENGRVQRASDIDLLWARRLGWPAYLGGPMFWAKRRSEAGRWGAALRADT